MSDVRPTTGERLALDIGIETRGGTFVPLINAESEIPCEKREIFSTTSDNQSEIEIHVLEGSSTTAAENRSLGKFTLTLPPAAPRGVPQIEVKFSVQPNLEFQLTARDLAAGADVPVLCAEPPENSSRVSVPTTTNPALSSEQAQARTDKSKDSYEVTRLIEMLWSSDVRDHSRAFDNIENAARALEKSNSASVIEPLIGFLERRTEFMEKMIDRYTELWRDRPYMTAHQAGDAALAKYQTVQFSAIRIFEKLGGDAAATYLKEMAYGDPDPDVREGAGRALDSLPK